MALTPPLTWQTVETAMCLWEAYLTADVHLVGEPKARLDVLREKEGTAALRSTIADLAPACDAAWDAAEKAGTQHEPFDWEHCPRWLAQWALDNLEPTEED
ncbi:hypothetical protein [Novosphingobium meiothermophilum]|uniref:hypothetical protein n=1 Tax=Novosphingobium meiothermophilum TaxID=2202251 RepID=UPI000D6DCECD|nr:hypothetical protein [Novosphingobium meiothermophilum]